ncbi:Peroxiredoxin [Alteribacillus persepolensis]|uniref:Peroxiredoxin n=1 Tax=Alteribacillus persepolensis TaxID=568899 RepID=A0A1G8H0X3_9BACI|nr:TlpA disulfide reductase family protein [Alteribacillus persepolensis]SDI00287.1 Peroxiredoxin [Alteribacillus persepolensis]
MHYVRKRLMFLSLCGVILLTGLFYQASNNPAKEAVQVAAGSQVAQTGQQAPSIELGGLDGHVYKTDAFFNKPSLFVFFASWCGICQEELPKLSRYYEENKNDINIIAVNATTQEYKKEDVEQFVKQAQLKMPVLLDESGDGIEAFRVQGVPVSYAIDENGVLRETFYGPMNRQALEEALGL